MPTDHRGSRTLCSVSIIPYGILSDLLCILERGLFSYGYNSSLSWIIDATCPILYSSCTVSTRTLYFYAVIYIHCIILPIYNKNSNIDVEISCLTASDVDFVQTWGPAGKLELAFLVTTYRMELYCSINIDTSRLIQPRYVGESYRS